MTPTEVAADATPSANERAGASPAGRLAGVAAAAGVGVAGTLVAPALTGLGLPCSPLVVALLLGLAIAQVCRMPAACDAGLAFACRPLLRLSLVLLGLRIGLPQLAALGVPGLGAVAAIVATTLAAGYWLARRLGLSRELALLLAAGHAICGAAAVAATDSLLKARERDVALALTLVTLLGTAAMLLCPLLGHLIGLPADAYAFWVGGSLHEVAQAVAAGYAFDGAGETASLVKMVRVAFLLPWGIVLALLLRRRTGTNGAKPSALPVPWFVVGFVLVALVDASVAIPPPVRDALSMAGTAAMTVAMASLGLRTSLRELAGAGRRPLLAAAATTLWISVLAFALA